MSLGLKITILNFIISGIVQSMYSFYVFVGKKVIEIEEII